MTSIRRYLPLAALLIAIGAIALGLSYALESWKSLSLTGQPEAQAPIDSGASAIISYQVENIPETCDGVNYGCDLRLVGVRETGSAPVLLDDNLTQTFRNQTGWHEDFVFIEPFHLPSASDGWGKLIFMGGAPSSKCCTLFSYDLDTKTFSPLTHDRLSSMWGDLGSPDGRLVLRMEESGAKLTVTDVLTDTIVLEIRTRPGETFVDHIGSYGGDPIGKYAWTHNGFFYSAYPASIEPPRDDTRTPTVIRWQQIPEIPYSPEDLE